MRLTNVLPGALAGFAAFSVAAPVRNDNAVANSDSAREDGILDRDELLKTRKSMVATTSC